MSDYFDPELDEEEPFEDEPEDRQRPNIAETIKTLREADAGGIYAEVFYGLSDLDPAEIAQLRDTWETLSTDYRARLLRQLVDVSEMNFDLDYTPLAAFALEDENADVRAAAVELLWIDETLPTMQRMINLALEDDAAPVRAAAASALGRFILLGEYEELPASQTDTAVDAALSIYNDHDEVIEVRRRALESLGNSSHLAVSDLIEEAYNSSEKLMRVSAVFAMGRTNDPKWEPLVLRELNSGDPELRYEAARAAGEIGLESAVAKLSRLVYEGDRDIKEVSIWSLGEIATSTALDTLDRLTTDPAFIDDEDLQEAIEDALLMASLPGGDLPLLELDDDDPFYDEDEVGDELFADDDLEDNDYLN